MNIDEGPFHDLLSRLEPDSPTFENRYKQLRFKLLKFFAWRRCEDPEILADETIIRAVRNIITGEEIRASNPYTYIYAIAKNVFREHLREKKKRQEIISNPPELVQECGEELFDCKRQCLKSLSLDKLNLLKQYYSSEDNREELARSENISLNALRLQIHRIRKDLRACYRACLKQLYKPGN